MYLALAGGVGGARLASGLAALLPADALTVIVNTGDDFTHCGLHISPDLDTVMYTLAGRHNPEQGWGLAGETWRGFDALARLGGPDWFRLGDEDLATHLRRTQLLSEGASLSAATESLCRAFGIRHTVAPMSDAPVRTLVHTDEGVLAFQHYFVRRRCEPVVRALEFAGAREATMSAAFERALASPQLRAVLVCPSNPYLSIDPILALPGVREQLVRRKLPVVVVSPIIGGAAVKGPAAKIMRELGHVPSSVEVARFYSPWASGILIDEADRDLAAPIEALGMAVHVAPSLMKDVQGQQRLARAVLAFAEQLSR